jgi:RNA-directed DNA polymerase
MELVVARDNMIRARQRVCANKGAPGIDGRTTEDLKTLSREHWSLIRSKLLSGTYRPDPVKRVEIPKPNGGTRLLGIPTVMDRLIQQAICQILTPVFDPLFSDHSYGFRPGRSARQAVLSAQRFQRDGRLFVVDMDLKAFFDEVNHDILMGLIRRRISDAAVLKVIRGYLNAGILTGGVVHVAEKGTPQGGPLSPLLSNILLNELDRELERRGHRFCRYADDCNIYVRTRRSGERVLHSIATFIEQRLKLKVNWEKSAVARPGLRKFLGFTFIGPGGIIRPSQQARDRFKQRVRELCHRGRGRKMAWFIRYELNPFLRGWFNYYRTSEQMKGFCATMDEWIRHRLRNIIWRQWKRPWTRRCNLMALGLDEERAVRSAFNKRGPWFNSGASHMNEALPRRYFDRLGLFSLLHHWTKQNESTVGTAAVRNRTPGGVREG